MIVVNSKVIRVGNKFGNLWTFRLFLRRRLFWADELFQACLLRIRGICEDAINLKNNKDEDNPSAICLVKVGKSILG